MRPRSGLVRAGPVGWARLVERRTASPWPPIDRTSRRRRPVRAAVPRRLDVEVRQHAVGRATDQSARAEIRCRRLCRWRPARAPSVAAPGPFAAARTRRAQRCRRSRDTRPGRGSRWPRPDPVTGPLPALRSARRRALRKDSSHSTARVAGYVRAAQFTWSPESGSVQHHGGAQAAVRLWLHVDGTLPAREQRAR